MQRSPDLRNRIRTLSKGIVARCSSRRRNNILLSARKPRVMGKTEPRTTRRDPHCTQGWGVVLHRPIVGERREGTSSLLFASTGGFGVYAQSLPEQIIVDVAGRFQGKGFVRNPFGIRHVQPSNHRFDGWQVVRRQA